MGRGRERHRASHRTRVRHAVRRVPVPRQPDLLLLPKLLAAFLSFLVLLGGCTAPATSQEQGQKGALPLPPNASQITKIVQQPQPQGQKQLLPSQVTRIPPTEGKGKLPSLPAPPSPPEPPTGLPEKAEVQENKTLLTFYYSPFCPYSARLRPILDSLKEKYGKSVEWEYIDATSEEGFEKFDSMLRENGLSAAYRAVPFVTIGKERFIGIDETTAKIEPYLENMLHNQSGTPK